MASSVAVGTLGHAPPPHYYTMSACVAFSTAVGTLGHAPPLQLLHNVNCVTARIGV